ncbi:MAG: YggS family pyridoxal phosphate-dependent enzyme [Flammeovirgaceae bacterium]|nr:YggS family pyridoxal phosphate-dependent enzyme [Flammeovirgaceae bacterium]
MSFNRNLSLIKENVDRAIKRSRYKNTVEIVAVTKTRSFQSIITAHNFGIKSIGENKIQEAEKKFQLLDEMPGLTKRFIGHLQTNKVKKCVHLFDSIDSVHSLKLIKKISTESKKINKKTPVLLEINTSEEKQKKGFLKNSVEEILLCFEQENVEIRGLMTMAPFTNDEILIRDSFAFLRQLKTELSQILKTDKLKELSMGMSNDYEIAIEEGATQVRIGTTLFGPRT